MEREFLDVEPQRILARLFRLNFQHCPVGNDRLNQELQLRFIAPWFSALDSVVCFDTFLRSRAASRRDVNLQAFKANEVDVVLPIENGKEVGSCSESSDRNEGRRVRPLLVADDESFPYHVRLWKQRKVEAFQLNVCVEPVLQRRDDALPCAGLKAVHESL